MRQLLIIIGVLSCFGCEPSGGDTRTDSTAKDVAIDSVKPVEKLYDMNVAAIKKQMELQKHLEDESNRTKYTEEDVNVAIPLIAQALKDNKFVQLPDEVFQQRIRTIFGDDACRTKTHDQFNTLFESGKTDDSEYDYTVNNVMVAKGQNFIFAVPFLGDFVTFTDSTHYKLNLQKIVISRNRYLLNDNKADLAFLMAEDTLFLKSLVLNYGYTADAKLNDLAMNDVSRWSDAALISACKYIFPKDCHGKLLIREGLLKWIGDHTTATDNRLVEMLDDFAMGLYSKDNKTYSLEEKRKITAYILNTYMPVYHKYVEANPNNWAVDGMMQNMFVYDKEMREYFIQQRYFGLEGLRKEIEVTIVK